MIPLAAQYAPLAYPAVVYGLGIALSAACLVAVVGELVGRLMDRRTRDHQLDDEIAALDHDEPSRAAVERAAMDALARAEAERDLDRFQVMTDDAFLDAMTAGRPHLRAIRDSQAEARSLDAEWETWDRTVNGGGER